MNKFMTYSEWFKVYHAENKEVYETFEIYAFQLINSGVTKLSASLIYERMRYESLLSKNPWKLNNNWRAYHARLFMQNNPEYEGIFRLRKTTSGKS